MSNLLDLLEIESKELAVSFQKASIEGQGTPQEVSDRRETAVKKFLEKYFPFPFRIAKGNISDSYGKRSASIDCIVLNPEHPYTVSDDEKFSAILADGVDFAIEVKPDLSNVNEINRVLNQLKTVKSLTRIKDGLLFKNRVSQEVQTNAKKIPSFVFSDKTYVDIRNLVEKIVEYYEQKSIKKAEQFDCIVINGRCLIFNSRENSYFNLNNDCQGILIAELGDQTLAGFILWLNKLPLSSPRMSAPVLEHYLKFDIKQLQTYHDLNARLIAIG
jgi:hypothetical protein